ncbi:sigma-54-dependent Fis family transcriptional regulator [Pseudomonas aeruginosa]|uniref:sigma-54-dependent Fis family transcriptional regulator n=1 Tax=Pseudomonas aeruginosa TaxID=287 RepID=UPI000FF0FEC8|nr:sigma-54-dependent Fis family transcriptional regulator [Pseudomonas aeruginosa]RPX12317.1 sigma-54-dependent Fis family transcriptional regulator [Pseudomonas aeruginosa]WCW83046.1 sigma-54-dependent Fis family transcriptional regulator [Pseudomonas aeruginosa]
MHSQSLDNCPNDLSAFIADHFGERDIQPESAIARSWYRSVMKHHLDPRARAKKHILTAGEIREHQSQHQNYLSIASQGVTGLARRVLPAGFAVLLSDENGITLDARLPSERERYTQAGLIIGARWDESIAGTNGIGTALAAGEALTIHRQEHFLVSNFRLSCSVAPIFDAQHQLRGCLNATCLYNDGPKNAQYLTLQLVILYARLIENASFRQRYRDRLTLSLKVRDEVSDLANEQLIALDDQGRVIGANHAAFTASRGELLGSRIEQLLEADVDQLLDLSKGGARGIRVRTLADHTLVDVGLRTPASPTRRSAPVATAKGPEHPNLTRLAGADPRLQEGVRKLRKVLDKGIAILITGETGTGKEAFARAIHQASSRHGGPFVALNCAAIPESLIESELFGYRGGSFTGASKKGMKGKLELANGGTLFLDEIGDMPAHLQTRLLRVLAEREILPLGAEAPVLLDVQVVSATHQNLAEMIRAKVFREDLFYRLAGMTLQLPALRERSDREALIDSLLASLGGNLHLNAATRECLRNHAWPGNIRQLLNCLRYASALAEEECIDLDCLPMELHQAAPAVITAPKPQSDALSARLDDDEARHLLAALRERHWNISAVAEQFGIARSTLYRKMKKHGISQPNALY